MTDEDRLMAALEYQRAMRAALGNQNLMRQGQRMNLPARQAPGLLSEFVNQGVSLDPQPDQGYGTMAAEMGLSFIPGVGQAMAARDLERGRRANDPLGMALAGLSFVPFGKLIGALRGGKQIGPVSQLDVYHGSPHRFPPTAKNPLGEFDASKIGTGEGAQAYGHGLYFAENAQVARDYQKNLGGGWRTAFNDEWSNQLPQPAPLSASMISKHNGDVKAAIADLRSSETPAYKQAGDWLEKQHSAGAVQTKEIGATYSVDLPDEQIAKMLDWDKPLSQQSKEVQSAMAKFYGVGLDDFKKMMKLDPDKFDKSGQQLVNDIAGRLNVRNPSPVSGAAQASNYLKDAGIPGIRYLDQGSRSGGKGTSNYVVFPGGESMLNILERNNQDVRNMMRQTVPDQSLMYKDPFGATD